MYGKLNDGNLTIAPRKLPGDGVVVYNPPESMYRAQGWKPVEFTDAPEAPEGEDEEDEETERAAEEAFSMSAEDLDFGSGDAEDDFDAAAADDDLGLDLGEDVLEDFSPDDLDDLKLDDDDL